MRYRCGWAWVCLVVLIQLTGLYHSHAAQLVASTQQVVKGKVFDRFVEVASFENEYDTEVRMLTLDVPCGYSDCSTHTEHPSRCYCNYASHDNCGSCESWPPGAFNCTAAEDYLCSPPYAWYEVPVSYSSSENAAWYKQRMVYTRDHYRFYLSPSEFPACSYVQPTVRAISGAQIIHWKTRYNINSDEIQHGYMWMSASKSVVICPENEQVVEATTKDGGLPSTWYGTVVPYDMVTSADIQVQVKDFPSSGTRKTVADGCDFGNELAACVKDGDIVSEPLDFWDPFYRVYYRTKLSGPCPQWFGLWFEGSSIIRPSLWVWADDTYTFDESGDDLPNAPQYTWNYEQTSLAFSYCPASGSGATVVHWAWENDNYIGDPDWSAWRNNWGVTMDTNKFGLHAASEFTLWSGFLNSWLSSAELVCGGTTYSLSAPNQRPTGWPNLVARLPTEQPNLLWPYAPHLTDIVYTNYPVDNNLYQTYSPITDNLFTSASLPAAKEPTIRHELNKTAMVLYLSTDTITKSRVTYALASDVANCMMITRPHMVDPAGMPLPLANSSAELRSTSCKFEQFSQIADGLRQDVKNLKTLSTTEFWGSAYWLDASRFSPQYYACRQMADDLLDRSDVRDTWELSTACRQTAPPWDEAFYQDPCCSIRSRWTTSCQPTNISVSQVTERSNVKLLGSCTNPACAATFLDDYIVSKQKVDLDGGCSSVVPSFSKYFREKMGFWTECETLTFGQLLGGVSCTTDSDCYVGVCSRTNSTCSYSKDQAERGFVQCLLDRMSLYPFLHGLQERLGLSDTPTPDDVLPYYRTSEGCWNDFEVQFPPDKRPHVTITVEPFIEQPTDGDCIHWGRLAGFSMNRPESLWAVGDTRRTPMSLAFSLWQVPIRCISTLYSRREGVFNNDEQMTEEYCQNANTPDSYCNWQTCNSWEDCAAACAFDEEDSTFCGYCHGGECTNVAGVSLADCPTTRGCLKADGSLSVLNPGDSDEVCTEATTWPTGQCDVACATPSCQSWRLGQGQCYAPYVTTASACTSLERNGVAGTWVIYNDVVNFGTGFWDRARFCAFPFGPTLCASQADLIYEDCATLSPAQCAQCATSTNNGTMSDGACPIVRQDILRCYMAPLDRCTTKSQCESSGSCSDWDIFWNESRFPPSNGSCQIPLTAENSFPSCSIVAAANGEFYGDAVMYGDFGCTMKKVRDPECSSAGGTVKVPARSEQECEDQGWACELEDYEQRGFQRQTWLAPKESEEHCTASGGTWRPVFSWKQGSWVGGQVVNLEVIDKAFVEPWEWRTDGLNYQQLADDLIKMLTDNYQLQLQSRQQCVFGSELEALQTLACFCTSSSTSCLDNVDINPTIASSRVCYGDDNMLAYPHELLFDNSSISILQCVNVEVRSDSAVHYYGTTSTSGSLSTTFTRYVVPKRAYGLYNRNQALYGQLLGDGVIIETDYPINSTNVCLKLRTDISRASEFNVYDFATLKRGHLVPLKVDATLKEGGFVCVKMDVDGANSTYFPIARYADYESRTNEELSEGETAVIAVIATAYLLTAILCLVCIILILFQQQLKQLHVFYFIMLPLLLIRGIYFCLILGGDITDASSVADYVLLQLPTFVYISAFSWIAYMIGSVLVRSRGPGHEKEATALLVSWFIFNIILYLLFMTLIILFEELPKDSVTDSCLGRVARKDTTGLSDAQFTLSIVYKVMVASVSIIMALLFLIAGGGLHYKLVILGKAKGGNSNWKIFCVGAICSFAFFMHAILLLALAASEWENSYAVLFLLLVEVFPAVAMLLIFSPNPKDLTLSRVTSMVSTATNSSTSSNSSTSYSSSSSTNSNSASSSMSSDSSSSM